MKSTILFLVIATWAVGASAAPASPALENAWKLCSPHYHNNPMQGPSFDKGWEDCTQVQQQWNESDNGTAAFRERSADDSAKQVIHNFISGSKK